jgi:hypothetical protein
MRTHPYQELPSTRYWRSAVSEVPRPCFDPLEGTKFTLTSDCAIATMGSCFAQNISHYLLGKGFNFVRAHDPCVIRDGSPVFSADYGNIYSTRQALQLVRAAFGSFTYSNDWWFSKTGTPIDPIRPGVQLNVQSKEAFDNSRDRLLENIRHIVRNTQCLILTLGLTEVWIRRRDAAALPSAPGVIAGEYNENEYYFSNLSVDDVRQDLRALIGLLTEKNPKIKVLLTISPVPLAATKESRHVVVSSCASKSILRCAADDIVRQFAEVDYFPSYEFFTSSINAGWAFNHDHRHANGVAVDRIMSLFFKHYFNGKSDGNARNEAPSSEYRRDQQSTTPHPLNALAGRIICDEDCLF